jgi:hypothetical protein
LWRTTHPIAATAIPVVHEVLKLDNYLEGSWEKFEQWIRNTIGSDFRWRVRPMDKRSNRKMVAELVQNDIKENKGVFPEKHSFIERI